MTAMFNGRPLFGPRGPSGPDGNPIGTIISYMGTKAPEDYLICDGKEYAIQDYSKLAEFFKTQFGTPNYFGGDGTTTFAVPDMRNLFLRGFHGESADQLSGEVGKKQDATEHIAFAISSDRTIYMSSPGTDYYEQTNVDSVPLKRINGYAVISPKENNWSHASDDMARYTSRPVNMAVLYCIKAVVSEPQEGTAGKDATINGVNTLEIVAGDGISLSQDGNKLIISSTSVSSVPTSLDDCSWEQISQLSQSGRFGQYFKVGDTKRITLNGKIGLGFTAQDLAIDLVVVGIDHNMEIESPGEHRVHFKLGLLYGAQIVLTDTKCGAGTSENYFNMNLTNTNVGGWDGSHMKKDIMGGTPESFKENSLMAALPADLRMVMKPVQKWTDNTGGGADIASYVTATTEYLCLPSEFELAGKRIIANSAEQNKQKQYEYWKTNSPIQYDSSSPSSAIASYMRSPGADGSDFVFCSIYSNGSFNLSHAWYSYGVNSLLFV